MGIAQRKWTLAEQVVLIQEKASIHDLCRYRHKSYRNTLVPLLLKMLASHLSLGG